MWEYILLSCVFSVLGLIGGWWMRGSEVPRHVTETGASDEMALAQNVLAQMHDLAANMAADVSAHSSRVTEINDGLNAVDSAGEIADVVTLLLQANEKMQRQLASAEEKLEDQAHQIQVHATEARTDVLTGLANRRAFDDEIERQHAEFQRQGRPTTLMLVDVDRFKQFNDMYGHQAGDDVLRGVGRILREASRSMDIAARYGGEEFAVIFPGTAIGDARPLAERIRQCIGENPFWISGKELRVTVSTGVTQFLPGVDAATLIQRADKALYAAKDAGRDCGYWHDGQSVHAIREAVQPSDEGEPSGDQASTGPCDIYLAEESKPSPTTQSPFAETVPHESTRDSLTGLFTAAEFLQRLEQHLVESTQGNPAVSVILAQVDSFAGYVEKYGQGTADTILRATSQFFGASARESDIASRYASDTLALLLPGQKLDISVAVAQRVRKVIESCQFPLHGKPLGFTVSVGVVQALADESSAGLLNRARQAMQHSAQCGNEVSLHDGESCSVAQKEPVGV